MTNRHSARSTVSRASPIASRAAAALFALAFVTAGASPAAAQASGNGFLFSEPRWTLGVRGGFDRALANSDIFTFMTDSLTLDRGDFSGFNFAADLAYAVSPRIDIAVGGGFVRSKKASEFRHYYESAGTAQLPITQTTTFTRLPLTATVKAYLVPRGRSIGSLAWIPTKFLPYVGLGGGAIRYEFSQEGDFVYPRVDGPDYDILFDTFASSGWSPMAHGLLGGELSLTPRIGFSAEGRYTWARADLDPREYEGFDPIDLSGFSTTLGLIIRF